MKPVLVPSICGLAVAGTSVTFYALFALGFGTATLGRIILLQASVSLVQMTLVPQTWIYVLGGTDGPQIAARYSRAMWIELVAGVIGSAAVAILAGLGLIGGGILAALAMFGSLWIAGSTSHQGYFRSGDRWGWFAAWMLLAPSIRLLAIVAATHFTRPSAPSLVTLVALFFLAPDLCRLLLINLIGLATRLRRERLPDLGGALGLVGHNWLYDLGTAIVENGDKILVGTLAGPTMLVVYFFARRIGTAIAIPLEPAFADAYRRLLHLPFAERPARLRHALRRLWLAVALIMAVAIVLIMRLFQLPAIGRFVPAPVLANLGLLLALLAIDGGVSANRWLRFLAQRGRRSGALLLFRLGLRALFGLALVAFAPWGAAASLVAGYALGWLIETIVVVVVARRWNGDPDDQPAPGPASSGDGRKIR